MNIYPYYRQLKRSKLVSDSFWSIFGNGLGSGLLLLAGIIIARFLGSDLYGEYGMVKSTMFYIASFSTFGLGITSTKYVAQFSKDKKEYVKEIISDSLKITFWSSLILSFFLVAFARPLSEWLDSPGLTTPFQYLGLIIICRSINMTQVGILGGIKNYRASAINAFISGLSMLIICVPLTFYFSINGALISLLISQIINCILNYISIKYIILKLSFQQKGNFIKELLVFSFPVALQESTYFIGHWGGLLILTKLSSINEVGLFSAASQWNAMILFIPSTLYNVVISHLSSNLDSSNNQIKIMKIMLAVNFISTLVPFIMVWICSGWIESFYGTSFKGMGNILTVLVCSSIFTCCSNVFRSQFIAHGKNWLLLFIRTFKDCIFLITAFILIRHCNGIDGGLYYSWSNLITSVIYFGFLLIFVVIWTNKFNKFS